MKEPFMLHNVPYTHTDMCYTHTHPHCIMVLLHQVCHHTVLPGVGRELCEYPQPAGLHRQLQLSVHTGRDTRWGEGRGPSGGGGQKGG